MLQLARVQQTAGRKERAAERYRQYLELLPDASDKAEVEAVLAELTR